MRPEIVVDLAAIRHNARTLAALVAPAALMTVVKADGYGHGIVESGRAARAGGATWLGVATVSEALALRDAGDTGRLLCWLTLPADVEDGSLARAIEADVDITAYTVERLDQIVAAGAATRARACSSRSTPGSPGVVRPSTTGRAWSPARPSTSAPAGPGSPASGRTSRAARSRSTPPTTSRRSASTRLSGSPRRPACDPRYVTSPTPPPRSCGPAAGSTWCASGWRPSVSTPRPTPTTTPTCAPR